MRSASRYLLKACAGLGCILLASVSCKKQTQTVQVEATLPPSSRALTLAPLSDPRDPKHDWINDLLSPRLSRISNLKWSCTEEKDALEIAFEGLETSCLEFVRFNFGKTKNPGVECLPTGPVRISFKDRKAGWCQSSTKPEILGMLRLPSGTGLYQSASGGQLLKPRAGALPDIRFSEKDTWLEAPDLRTWFAAAGFNGAYWLLLKPTHYPTDPTESAALLAQLRRVKDDLSRLKPPNLLRPSPELVGLANTKGSTAKTPPKAPLLRIQDDYKDPLYHEACRYVRLWIQTRQLLSEEDAPAGASRKELSMDCLLIWENTPLPGPSILLAKLPLPLVVQDSGDFPFKTVEDATSPSLFQSLKLAK